MNIEVIYSNSQVKEHSLKYGTKGSACADLCADIAEPVSEFESKTNRGTNGFGSTGTGNKA